MPTASERPAFTLRFQDESLHRDLQNAAEQLGIPMRQIAEEAIKHELVLLGVGFEDRLTRSVERLQTLRRDGFERDVKRFAQGEVTVEDPLRSRHLGTEDPLGVGASFAHPVE